MSDSDLNKIAKQRFSLCTKTNNEWGRKRKEKLIASSFFFLEIQARAEKRSQGIKRKESKKRKRKEKKVKGIKTPVSHIKRKGPLMQANK